eukprot:g345.t1
MVAVVTCLMMARGAATANASDIVNLPSLSEVYLAVRSEDSLDNMRTIVETARARVSEITKRKATQKSVESCENLERRRTEMVWQARLALSLQRYERIGKIGKGFSGFASAENREAHAAFEAFRELADEDKRYVAANTGETEYATSSELSLFYTSYAILLRESGVADLADREAIALHREAVQLVPNNSYALLQYGVTLQMLGRKREAENAYDLATKFSNALDPTALIRWSHMHRFVVGDERDEERVRALRAALKFETQRVEKIRRSRRKISRDTIQTLAQLYFASGKAYSDMERINLAFRHFESGNELWREIAHHDSSLSMRRVEMFARIISPTGLGDIWTNRFRIGHASEAPIFIIGMPRSGSTLVEQILTSHSDVFGGGEDTSFVPVVSKLLGGLGASDASPDLFAKYGKVYVDEMLRRSAVSSKRPTRTPTRFFTDKNLYNFWYTGLIHVMLPHAKIVHIVRDPRATCFSMYTSLFLQGEGTQISESYSFEDLGRAYADYDRMMQHYESIVPSKALLRISYEEIVLDFEASVEKLAAFVGLAVEPQMLHFWKKRRVVSTASNTQVNTPLYATSIDKWRAFEKHLGPLVQALPRHVIEAADRRLQTLRGAEGRNVSYA